jgi:hypothetical protein
MYTLFAKKRKSFRRRFPDEQKYDNKVELKNKERSSKPYKIQDEVCCSPEFPQGCISWDN